MPAVKLSPIFNSQVVDEDGAPAVGWKIYTYAAGSSNPVSTFTENTGTTPQSNPIVLNALGFPTMGQIWLISGQAYKLQLTDANDVVKKTEDYVSGVNDTATGVDEWTDTGITPTYVSSNSFTLQGDQTSNFHIGRRQKFQVTAGTVYGRITASVFTTLTTVTLQMDGSQALDSGLSSAQLSILRNNVLSLPERIAVVGGVVNAYTATVGIARLVLGDEIKLSFPVANNGVAAPTLNLDSTGVLPILLPNGAVPGGGALSGEHKLRVVTGGFVVLNPNPVSVSQKIQPLLQPTISAGALTIGINPTSLDFRSVALGSPAVNTRAIASAVSMTLPSGSGLGARNNSASRFVVLAIDNAGIIEPAVVNLAGGVNLDETNLVNTVATSSIPQFTGSMSGTVLTVTAVASGTLAVGQTVYGTGISDNTVVTSLGTGTGGNGTYNISNSQTIASEPMNASSASVIYSATARTGVPYRVVGFYDESNPVAGVHSVLPTLVQGTGGQALAALSSLGYGESPQNVAASRAAGTTYYNTRGRPLLAIISAGNSGGGTSVTPTVNGILFPGQSINVTASQATETILVPPGGSYSVAIVGTLGAWIEYR